MLHIIFVFLLYYFAFIYFSSIVSGSMNFYQNKDKYFLISQAPVKDDNIDLDLEFVFLHNKLQKSDSLK